MILLISMRLKQLFLELLETFLSSVVILLVIYMFVALPEMVWGSSMEPNFHTGERVLVEKITRIFKPAFERGEVVIIKPEGSTRHIIKRVIGIPGDIIKVYNCKVFISRDNSKYVLEEPYLAQNTCTKGGTQVLDGKALKLGNNEYVLLGDNRGVSLDSRILGPIKSDRIVGRVVFRWWPPAKVGFVR
ncbi:signal peptidase I [candidate division WWE3 bacterium RBG_13_37_7]|uniref:Signal peptidase I n=1 Tax=candidate division WWE3 bacterium RBG_13_37_7 TaxID=1802609 RepID=A0A1F4U292_UNCKA|nr:MAG: signal peptidase I [candidate division WWE3 bacterium RBG_13_37_7]